MAQLAFPTAIGSGAYTTGGRNGIIVHVTQLDGSNNQVGSLSHALKMTVPRIIVFDIGGVHLTPKFLFLDSTNSDFTILGQTSPEGGVTIAGGRVYFDGVTNYIMRYVRFKGGFQADWIPNNNDNLGSNSFAGVGNQLDIIVDHVSFGFGATMPTWSAQGDNTDAVDRVTVQNCLFSETDKGAIIGKDVDRPTYRETGSMTFYKNIFYNTRYRLPNTTGNHPNDTSASFDVINNLSWNIQGRFVRGAGNQNLNHLNNAMYQRNFVLNDENLNLWSLNWTPKIHTSGNLIFCTSLGNLTDTVNEMNTDNTLSWKYFDFNGPQYGNQLPTNFFVSQYPLRGKASIIENANDLRLTLPNQIGCNARLSADGSVSTNLDVHDAEYLENITNDIMVTPLDKSEYSITPITPSTRPVGYYNLSKSTDIPETWFDANVPNGEIATDLSPRGYTWIEEFANQVDAGEVINIPQITRTDNNPTTIELGGTYIPPTGTWSDNEDGTGTATVGGDTVDVNTLGVYNVTLFHTDTDTNTGTLTIPYTIVPTNSNVEYTLTENQRLSGRKRLIKLIKGSL